MMIAIARNALIVLAVLLSPAWLMWVAGGWIADRAGQRRVSLLKGDRG